MKKFFTIIATAVALLSISSCDLFYEENVDTIVNFEFADDNGEIMGLGLEKVLTSYQTLIDTFGAEFKKAGAEELIYEDQFLLRGQKGQNRAEKNIKKIADKAAAHMEAGFTCPIDGIFTITMTYGTKVSDVIVWQHDYRPAK